MNEFFTQAISKLSTVNSLIIALNLSLIHILLSILVVLYLAYLASNIASYLMRRRYGKVSTTSDGTQVSDTYHSRMLTLVISTFIAVVALIAALVLLNSDMVSEGDLIEIDHPPLIGRVFKTKIFHTVLIDVVNNHRVMISNSKLRDHTIQSLSKFASARGLRERLIFKIGYDTSPAAVKRMFTSAFDQACTTADGRLDKTHPLEIRMLDAGDHAVEWAVFYYIKDAQPPSLLTKLKSASSRH